MLIVFFYTALNCIFYTEEVNTDTLEMQVQNLLGKTAPTEMSLPTNRTVLL